jgi:hypothetical protein
MFKISSFRNFSESPVFQKEYYFGNIHHKNGFPNKKLWKNVKKNDFFDLRKVERESILPCMRFFAGIKFRRMLKKIVNNQP